jgi:cobalt-precorrin 5A hydrolase
MKTAVLSITDGGLALAEKISAALGDSEALDCRGRLKEVVEEKWSEADGLVFVMATGIVVRLVAPLLDDKYSDPCVLALDEKGRFVISLLSGHLGGGNGLARQVAEITGGEPVITTASDVLGHTALDLWAGSYGLAASDPGRFARVAARLVNSGSVTVYSNCGLPDLPHDMQAVNSPGMADMVITIKSDVAFQGLTLYPRSVVAGIGCNRGTSAADIEKAFVDTCAMKGISPLSVRAVASIDLKRDETGLLEFASSRELPLLFFTRDEINGVRETGVSETVMKAVGARGVAEPAAILGAGKGRLIVRKVKWKDVTVAMARDALPWWEQGREQ